MSRYAVVAVVTGRRSEDIAGRLPVPGLSYHGLFGLESIAEDLSLAIAPAVEAAASRVPEAWVEHKGVSVAVHIRAAADPAAARAALVGPLRAIAADEGLRLVEGKAVLELLPAGRPLKGGAVERIVGEHALDAALFAGDDVADLEAFDALGRLAAEREGFLAVRVAVRGPETPEELLDAADVVVDGPTGLVELLAQIA